MNIIKKILNREVIMYVIFGVLTSLLNIGLYAGLTHIGMDYIVANFITLVIVKLAAYVVNKIFVFQTKCSDFMELTKEFLRFVVTRGITMIVDFVGLIFMVEILSIDSMISKIFMTILVVVLNYIFGKLHVFKK